MCQEDGLSSEIQTVQSEQYGEAFFWLERAFFFFPSFFLLPSNFLFVGF